MSSARKTRKSLSLFVFATGLALGVGGSCLPDNYFSDLVGGLVADSIGAVIGQAVDSILTSATPEAV